MRPFMVGQGDGEEVRKLSARGAATRGRTRPYIPTPGLSLKVTTTGAPLDYSCEARTGWGNGARLGARRVRSPARGSGGRMFH